MGVAFSRNVRFARQGRSVRTRGNSSPSVPNEGFTSRAGRHRKLKEFSTTGMVGNKRFQRPQRPPSRGTPKPRVVRPKSIDYELDDVKMSSSSSKRLQVQQFHAGKKRRRAQEKPATKRLAALKPRPITPPARKTKA